MHTKDDLMKALDKLGLDYYETVSDVIEENAIELKDFGQLCLFVQKHGIDTIFYHYEFACAEELQITEKVLKDIHIDQDILEVVQKDFDKYNMDAIGLDYSRPYLLTAYCLYQGHIFYVIENDYWFKELGFGTPQKAAIALMEGKFEEIENKREVAAVKREEQRDQLRGKILADRNFHRCTNKELRRAYTQKLWNADESIHSLFYSPTDGVFDIMIGAFIEEVWKEYKAKL